MVDRFADRWFERIDAASGEVAGRPVADQVGRLRPEVRALMISFRDDGSWPETELLMELVQTIVDVVDAGLADADLTAHDLADADQRWLSACRQSAGSSDLMQDMLDDVRPDVGRAGYSGDRRRSHR